MLSENLDEHVIEKLTTKYPNRIPIKVMFGKNLVQKSDIKNLKTKYLVPKNYTISKFMCILRSKIDNLKDSQGLFLLINNELPPVSDSIGAIYNKHSNRKTYLEAHLILENTFG